VGLSACICHLQNSRHDETAAATSELDVGTKRTSAASDRSRQKLHSTHRYSPRSGTVYTGTCPLWIKVTVKGAVRHEYGIIHGPVQPKQPHCSPEQVGNLQFVNTQAPPVQLMLSSQSWYSQPPLCTFTRDICEPVLMGKVLLGQRQDPTCPTLHSSSLHSAGSADTPTRKLSTKATSLIVLCPRSKVDLAQSLPA
jgi:hypothetical protein